MLRARYTQRYSQNIQNCYNIFRIFWNYFWYILEIKVFQNKNQSLCKKHGCFLKMADTYNNKLTGLLIIAGGSLLLSQEHIKERKKTKTKAGSLDKREIV